MRCWFHSEARCSMLAAILLAGTAHAFGQGMPFRAEGLQLQGKVRSLEEIRQAKVVRQKWDLSCGSAALSTLLTYDLGAPTPETEIIVWILHRTDPVRIQSRGGFSLLDLKHFATAHGFAAEGYADLSPDDLAGMHQPAIVPVRVKGYDHFVVFRGIVGDRVLLADPAFGNLTEPKERFAESWKNGLAFFVSPRNGKQGKESLKYGPWLLVPSAGAVYRSTAGRAIFQPTRPLQ